MSKKNDSKWNELVKDAEEYLQDKYSEPLADEELSTLAGLLFRVKYSKQFVLDKSVENFVRDVTLQGTMAECRLLNK